MELIVLPQWCANMIYHYYCDEEITYLWFYKDFLADISWATNMIPTHLVKLLQLYVDLRYLWIDSFEWYPIFKWV